MRAIITPVGLSPITVELESDPTWTDRETGGWADCQFTAVLDEYVRSRLYKAEVELVAGESCYFGFVRKWEGDTITCHGWWDEVAETEPREVLYADDSLQPWKERTFQERNPRLMASVDGTVLRLAMEGGVALGTKANGFYRLIPSTTSSVVTFGWSRPSTSAIALRLYYGTYSPQAATGYEFSSLTQAWEQPTGSGPLASTSSYTVTINAQHDCLLFLAYAPGGYTPPSDTSAYFHSINIYSAVGTTVTPDAVITNVAANLPAYLKPGGIDIAADSTSTLMPFVFGDDATPATIGERVLDYTDAQLRFEKRLAGAVFRPALVFRDRPQTPSLLLDAHEVEANLTGGDVGQLYTHVRVLYTDALGEPRSVDVEDTDATHPLVRQWKSGGTWLRERWTTISADTTSAANATVVGQTFLTLYGAEQVRGTVTVNREVSGTSPALIAAGALATLTNTEFGTVNVRIREVAHTGDTQAVLTLDNTPTLDDLLASLGKQQGRFNAVQFIDRRSGR